MALFCHRRWIGWGHESNSTCTQDPHGTADGHEQPRARGVVRSGRALRRCSPKLQRLRLPQLPDHRTGKRGCVAPKVGIRRPQLVRGFCASCLTEYPSINCGRETPGDPGSGPRPRPWNRRRALSVLSPMLPHRAPRDRPQRNDHRLPPTGSL
jgi:hypothetical protein